MGTGVEKGESSSGSLHHSRRVGHRALSRRRKSRLDGRSTVSGHGLYFISVEVEYEGAVVILLADLVIEGRKRSVILHAPTNGFFYVIDRETGKLNACLDVLIQNPAISNTNKKPGQSVEEYSKTTRPSVLSLGEMRVVWDTNVSAWLPSTNPYIFEALPGPRK